MLSCSEQAAGQGGHCRVPQGLRSPPFPCFPRMSPKCLCISLALWENKVKQYAGVLPSENKLTAWTPWAKIQGRE